VFSVLQLTLLGVSLVNFAADKAVRMMVEIPEEPVLIKNDGLAKVWAELRM